MKYYGKIFYSVDMVGWELAYVRRELGKVGVAFQLIRLNEFESLLWFDVGQVRFLPPHLGVNDYLDDDFNKALPAYTQVLFYRVDERIDFDLPLAPSTFGSATFPFVFS